MAGYSFLEVSVFGDDPGNCGFPSGRQDADPVARHHHSRRDLAAEAAEVEVRTVDPLHRHAEWASLQVFCVDFHGLKVVDEGRAFVPRCGIGLGRDIVASQTRNRNGKKFLNADFVGKSPIVRDNVVEHFLVIADKIHLVNGKHDFADADQFDEETVAAGLCKDALAGIDQDDRQVGGGCAGDHISRVLLVAWRVGDYELALVRGEKAIGDIDGDALFAFRCQSVDQQGEIDLASLRAYPLRVGFQRGHLVLEDHLRVVKQAPDER